MPADRVPRALRRGWQNNRPAWSRRCRWYEWRSNEGVSIRLQFETRDLTTGTRKRVNRFYSDDALALNDMERFEQGESLRVLRNEADT
jgi:hypothetical protein